MATIKIKGGIPLSKQIPELIQNSEVELKLPFQATGFKSEKVPVGVVEKDYEKGKVKVNIGQVLGNKLPEKAIEAKPVLKYKEKLTNIKGIGEEIAEELIELYPNWEAFTEATKEELIDISGIGPRLAEKILEQVGE